jgi:uncharacterized protein (TIGR03000 family)
MAGCYGGWGWGAGAYWGSSYDCFGCHGCYGCYGSFGCAGYSPYGPPTGPPPEQIPAPKVDEKGKQTMLAPAKVTVQLPPEAKLYIDDRPIKMTNQERRTFNTPWLERGQTYFYDVRVEVVRDGKTLSDSKRVLVRPGQEVKVSFPKLEAPVLTAEVGPRR